MGGKSTYIRSVCYISIIITVINLTLFVVVVFVIIIVSISYFSDWEIEPQPVGKCRNFSLSDIIVVYIFFGYVA